MKIPLGILKRERERDREKKKREGEKRGEKNIINRHNEFPRPGNLKKKIQQPQQQP